ncbi:MAG: exopolysaccharide biosynthesis polyprenyl glycosylphosphotransferase [Clostridia bacterium]|nr:exopolysaccharide biosynthesis polyprenyl glycosylphosphotransferase [Clostridia bacterium]
MFPLRVQGSVVLKNKNEQFKRTIRSLFTILLILSETAIFAYAWINEYNDYIVLPFVQKGNWFFYAVYVILFSIFLNSFDGLKYGSYRKTNLIIAQILATLATAFIVYLQIVLLTARFVTVTPLLLMFFADTVIIVLIVTLGEWLLRKLFPAKRVLVVYDGYSPSGFIDKISARKDKFRVEKIVNISVGFEEIEGLIKQAESVIIYDVHSEARNKILKICFENDVRAYTTTKVSDVLVRGAESLHIFDTPLLLYRNIGLSFEQRFLKRSLDILVSALMLIITSPVFLICALAIKLYDGGPVFFRQARGTMGGKIFRIHKFRSMIVDAEKDGSPRPAEEKDDRITPVGRILRASRLDELPQLIDILVGNMSLVGPRPERIEHIRQYTEEIPEFQYRLKVRGGLTGYAQLYGKYNTTPYDKLQLDLMYIQNYSFFLDIRLLLMTLKIIFIRESTEGFSHTESKKITDKSKK